MEFVKGLLVHVGIPMLIVFGPFAFVILAVDFINWLGRDVFYWDGF